MASGRPLICRLSVLLFKLNVQTTNSNEITDWHFMSITIDLVIFENFLQRAGERECLLVSQAAEPAGMGGHRWIVCLSTGPGDMYS